MDAFFVYTAISLSVNTLFSFYMKFCRPIFPTSISMLATSSLMERGCDILTENRYRRMKINVRPFWMRKKSGKNPIAVFQLLLEPI